MGSALDWVFPVVGSTEWSHGSWMPDTDSHRGRPHPAIDIYAPEGSPIVAPVSGVVRSIKTSDIGGNTAYILGDDGNLYYFAHMRDASSLRPGNRIEKAALIGFVGNTGSARNTKSHVHFSMRDAMTNDYVDPYSYLNDGYKLDGLGDIPGMNFGAGAGDEVIIPYSPDMYGYAGANDIFDAVMGGDEPPATSTSAEIVGGVLSSVSNMIAGGERMDYRGLGTTGVRQADLQLLIKEPGDETAVDNESVEQEGLTVKKVGQQSSVEEV